MNHHHHHHHHHNPLHHRKGTTARSRRRTMMLGRRFLLALFGIGIGATYVSMVQDNTNLVRRTSTAIDNDDNDDSAVAPPLSKLLHKTTNATTASVSSTSKAALDCLRLTNPQIPDLEYPSDALEHYHHIHHKLGKWLQHAGHKPHGASGYHGPWIENAWITHFQTQLEYQNYALQKLFGPYIPIFVPWTDVWVSGTGKKGRIGKYSYPKDMIAVLAEVLRDDVLYITVNQNDDGFVGRCSELEDLQRRHHITVLSAGGYGHVPVPLLKQPEPLRNTIPARNRTHLVSYVGSYKNAPNDMRRKMIAQGNHKFYYGEDWRDVMADSKFSLCPRGFGRTSYHVMETLQMGLVPIQVYLDEPWLPYANLLRNISYAVTPEDLPGLIAQLANMSEADHAAMERRIALLRNDYFTMEGVMDQIGKFMLQPANSELVCRALPPGSGSGTNDTQPCA